MTQSIAASRFLPVPADATEASSNAEVQRALSSLDEAAAALVKNIDTVLGKAKEGGEDASDEAKLVHAHLVDVLTSVQARLSGGLLAGLDDRDKPETVRRLIAHNILMLVALVDQFPDIEASAISRSIAQAASRVAMAGDSNVVGFIPATVVARLQKILRGANQAALKQLPEPVLKPYEQRVPSTRAGYFINIGKKEETQKIEEAAEKKTAVKSKVVSALQSISNFNYIKATNGERFERQLTKVVVALTNSKKISISILDKILKLHLEAYFDERCLQAAIRSNRDIVPELRKIVKAKEGPSQDFHALYAMHQACQTMDLATLWRETALPEGSAAEKQQSRLDQLANRANSFVMILMGSEYRFCPEVEAANDIQELQAMVLEIPLNQERFKIVQSAVSKLEIMHVLLLLESGLNQDETRNVSHSLARRLKRMATEQKRDGNDVLIFNYDAYEDGSPTGKSSPDEIIIGSLVVDETGKTTEAIAEKMFMKQLVSPSSIKDRIRAYVKLTEKDTFGDNGKVDPEKMEAAATRIIGVILSEFGDDVQVDRIRYALRGGKTKDHSTGGYYGINFTLTYKHQNFGSGINDDGSPMTGTSQIEIQVKGATEDDHALYKANRKAKIRELLGQSIDLKGWILDLVDIINTGHDFGYETISKAPTMISRLDVYEADYLKRAIGIGDIEIFPEYVDCEKLLGLNEVPVNRASESLVILFLETLSRDKNAKLLESLTAEHHNPLHQALQVCANWNNESPRAQLIQHKAKNLLKQCFNGTGSIFQNTTVKKEIGGYFVHKKRTGAADLKIPYAGPVSMRCEEKDGEKRFFEQITWQHSGGTTIERLAYLIKKNQDGLPECYLVSSTGENVLIWTSDRLDSGKVRIISCKHDVQRVDGVIKLVPTDIDLKNSRVVEAERLDELTPITGMPRRCKRFYKMLGDSNLIESTSKKKASSGSRRRR